MNKKIVNTSVLLTLALVMAIPLIPAKGVFASSPASVSVVAGSVEIGQPFDANVMASNVPGPLVAYDVIVRWDPTALALQSASLGNTVFDLNHDNSIADEVGSGALLIGRADVFPALGLVRYVLVLTGGASVPAGSYSLAGFSFVAIGNTASAYPAVISLPPFPQEPVLVVNGGELPITTSDGVYMPPANVDIRSIGCRATIPGLNLQAHGNTEGLFCKVINTGTNAGDYVAIFQYNSLVAGSSGTVVGTPVSLAPGQLGQLDGSLTVPGSSDVFVVQGIPARAITFPDSSVLIVPGSASDVFKFNVNVCTSGNC